MRRATRFIAYGLITGLCAIALAIVHHAGTITYDDALASASIILILCGVAEALITVMFGDVV